MKNAKTQFCARSVRLTPMSQDSGFPSRLRHGPAKGGLMAFKALPFHNQAARPNLFLEVCHD